MDIANLLRTEVCASTSRELHPAVDALVAAFLKYLKEPRYLAPLTLKELKQLFINFYTDLNQLVVHTYTHLKQTKKKMIMNCKYFADHPKEFDYLLAIANYSTLTVKLTKRNDPDALTQLRVFNFYKFLVIYETLQAAHNRLFGSEFDEGPSLYEKIFKFEQKDLLIQEFFDEKLGLFREMNLPIVCFGENEKLSLVVDKYPTDLINNHFKEMNDEVTPLGKLRHIVSIQRILAQTLATVFDNDLLKVNNDVLLPALIHFIVYHHNFEDTNLYLNFTFMQNFLSLLEDVDLTSQPVQLSIMGLYNPEDRHKFRSRKRAKSVFEAVNLDLDEVQTTNEEPNVNHGHSISTLAGTNDPDSVFASSKNVIAHIQSEFLNNGELRFFLTNFEAALLYLLSVTLKELLPEKESDQDLLNDSLETLVDAELLLHFKFPAGEELQQSKYEQESEEVTTTLPTKDNTRSRSSSLFNTILSRFNEATLAVNRLRSNSSNVKNESFPLIDMSGNSVLALDSDVTQPESGNLVRNIMGRISLAQILRTTAESPEQSIEAPSPHNRTRSSSLEKRNSLSSKLSIGVSDIMGRLNNNNTNILSASLPSLENPTHVSHGMEALTVSQSSTSPTRRPEVTRSRTASLQVMDKWISNLQTMGFSNGANNTVSLANGHIPVSQNGSQVHLVGQKEHIDQLGELTRYQNITFESLTINDLKKLKENYDRLCILVESREGSMGTNSEQTSI